MVIALVGLGIFNQALHVTKSDHWFIFPFVQQGMIVSCEQTQALTSLDQVLDGGTRNGRSIESRRPPTKFVFVLG